MMIAFRKISRIFFSVLWLSGMGCFSPPASCGSERVPAATQVAEKENSDLQDSLFIPDTEMRWPRLTKTVTGRVTDGDRRPIAGARIAMNVFPFASTLSRDDGIFTLGSVPSEGPCPLEIYHEQYLPLFTQIDVHMPDTSEPGIFVLVSLTPLAPGHQGFPNIDPPGQGAVEIEAERFLYEQAGDVYRARGNVVIAYAGNVLSAAAVDLYHGRNEAYAEGNVRLKGLDGDVLEGKTARVDLKKQTGVVQAGRIFMAKNHFYVRGERIEKTGQATYFVVNAEATSCDGESPDWRLAGKELDVTIDGYGTLTHGRFYARNLPIVYAPYLLFPVKTTRQSGFLLPERMAYSQNRLGWDVGIPFFWAFSDAADATFHQRYMSERGFQEGIELRYILNNDSYGVLYGDYLRDGKKITETVGNHYRDWQDEKSRWSFYLNHETRIDPSLYLRTDIARVSDSFYFRDFSSHNYFLSNYSQARSQPFRQIAFVGDESLASLDSTVRLVKSWKAYNLTALIKSTQDFTVPSNDITLQRYPEIALTGIKQPLGGTPIQYELSGVYDYFHRGKGQTGHLVDAYPALSMPFGWKGYGHLTPFAGLRSLVWKRDDAVGDGLKKEDHLEIFTAGATLSGEIHRVFSIGGKQVDKIRHGIRPEITYLFSPSVKQDGLPDFIAAAGQQNTVNNTLASMLAVQGSTAAPAVASDLNAVVYAVTNTLTARIPDLGGSRRYVEFLRFKVAQAYNIREANKGIVPVHTDRRPLSDISLELDLLPLRYVTVNARNRYSVYDTNWTQENYDLVLRDHRGDSASITYRYTRNTIKETNLILKAVVTKNLDLNFRLKQDHFNEREIEKIYGFDYRRQCWSVGFDYGESADGSGKGDRVYAFRFSLFGL